MADYVGNWDCSYCGTKGIAGYIYDCPGCDHPRPKNVKFYLPENPQLATSEQMELMGHDPNWYCTYCDSGNKDSNTHCWNCGGEKGNAPSHKTTDYQPNEEPHSSKDVDDVMEDLKL